MTADPMRLDGLVAVVTGAAQGIGAAIARALAAAGAKIVIGDLQEATAVVIEIEEGGGEATALVIDVSARSDVDELMEHAVARFGALDILVNNAGIDAPPGNAWDLSLDDWDRTIAVNLTGAFHCSQAAILKMMSAASGGAIVNISSHVAWLGTQGISPAYNASKGGVIGLTAGFAAQLAPHRIRVNAVAPALVMSRDFGWSQDEVAGYERAYSLGPGDPSDVAQAVRYLASPAAKWVTGSVLYIHGGFRRGGPLL